MTELLDKTLFFQTIVSVVLYVKNILLPVKKLYDLPSAKLKVAINRDKIHKVE
jgi:hypothetical protein